MYTLPIYRKARIRCKTTWLTKHNFVWQRNPLEINHFTRLRVVVRNTDIDKTLYQKWSDYRTGLVLQLQSTLWIENVFNLVREFVVQDRRVFGVIKFTFITTLHWNICNYNTFMWLNPWVLQLSNFFNK